MELVFRNKKKQIISLIKIRGNISNIETENIELKEFGGIRFPVLSEYDFLNCTGALAEKNDNRIRTLPASNA